MGERSAAGVAPALALLFGAACGSGGGKDGEGDPFMDADANGVVSDGGQCAGPRCPDATPDPDAFPAGPCQPILPAPCGDEGGLAVYCVTRESTVKVAASVSYPPGLSVMAMGVGTVLENGTPLGYIGAGDPFSCIPEGCENAVGTGNSGAEGKICEIDFDLTLPETAVGTAGYAITVDADAEPGDFRLGFAATSGSEITGGDFYLRVLP